MSEHTKGPWKVSATREFDDHGGAYALISSPGWGGLAQVVVRMAHEKSEHSEGLTNAALIAAAPDLLEALEAIAKMSDSTEAWFHDDLWGNETDAWEDGQSRGHFDAAVIARAVLKKAKP